MEDDRLTSRNVDFVTHHKSSFGGEGKVRVQFPPPSRARGDHSMEQTKSSVGGVTQREIASPVPATKLSSRRPSDGANYKDGKPSFGAVTTQKKSPSPVSATGLISRRTSQQSKQGKGTDER
ncbi:unnamed protein product [Musa textilis]